ncbi:hypothetical protein EMWEY_00051830 [Eimeria maxima]|uniref:Uncharacterized protein n=1 Tax=Eimeria maxima TaxID=5804 RepID=U6LWF4_EIMMA|nr:hypothetical protein EMWEY_00051830 [Eimeria maxima]CDJ56297.1 hypothetical protein EMWEY_00051830 [Eimeria maxima]
MDFSYLVKRERRSDGAGSSGGEAGQMALIKEEDDRLNTELLQLQDEAINLQQKGTQMQLEYEEVQSQVIRELCR